MSTKEISTNRNMDGKMSNGGTHIPSQQYYSEVTVKETDDDNDKNKKTSSCCECLCLKRISNGIVSGLETTFYKLGKLVARHPLKTIFLCLLVCGAAGVGLRQWHEEKEYVKVWLPRGSPMYDEYIWVKKHFPDSVRFDSMIIEDENVLTPRSLNAMYDLYERSNQFKLVEDHTLHSICIKAGPVCRVSSLLELWSYNPTIIRHLTTETIYNTLNQNKVISPMYGNEMNLNKLLGDISRDNASKIIGAKATTMFWLLERNDTTHLAALDWEKQLIDTTNTEGHPHLIKLYIYTERSFDDEYFGGVQVDMMLMAISFLFVLIFVIFTMSHLSHTEQKIFLALAGLLSIGLAIIFTYGIGFATGIMFGPIHQILPFMLLGIGVDDIFVIMESLKHLTLKERELPVEDRIALTMKHAGVSITVTSITDIVAFAIGSSTVIPSLSTFCVYAAIGVLALYILQATYFVACLTLDERRVESKRNACIMCFKHDEDYQPNKFYNLSLQHLFMKKIWGPLLMTTPAKVVIIIIAVTLSSVNIWSFTQLKHDFDPSMYLPTDSYSTQFVFADRKYFPDDGALVTLYCGKLDYPDNVDQLMELYDKIRHQPTVQKATVNFWLAGFQQWSNTTNKSQQNKNQLSQNSSSAFVYEPMDFYGKLGIFLKTAYGQAYMRNIKVDSAQEPKQIKSFIMTFRHVKCLSSTCNIAAMMDMRNLVDNYKFTGGQTCFAYSNPQYMFNETNQVLKLELYRNLALAAVCVFVVTLILIANFWTSLLVFICVVLTVIDVAGTMQFWDISVDTASSVILILCFGLAVDYSAHIGHCFMTVSGSNNERAKKTLVKIGPAVFSGGFSTFLAFLLLVNSVSYGFTLFFRIFTSVVIFGLFHGLALLPVLLSLVGPAPYEINSFANSDDKHTNYTDVPNDTGHIANGYLDNVQLTEVNTTKPVHVNGDLHKGRSVSKCDINDGLEKLMNDQNPRYSGSYYEQLSDGSLIQIECPEPAEPLVQKSDQESVH